MKKYLYFQRTSFFAQSKDDGKCPAFRYDKGILFEVWKNTSGQKIGRKYV